MLKVLATIGTHLFKRSPFLERSKNFYEFFIIDIIVPFFPHHRPNTAADHSPKFDLPLPRRGAADPPSYSPHLDHRAPRWCGAILIKNHPECTRLFFTTNLKDSAKITRAF
jgi:hypothetical protein